MTLPVSNPQPAGRKTSYKPEYAGIAAKLALEGKIDTQIAEILGVSNATVYNWKNQFPAFLEALKLSKDIVDAKVAKSLFDRAMGYSHPEEKIFYDSKSGDVVVHETTKQYAPDPTSMIFWLKNRQPDEWRDKREVDHTVAGNIEVKVSKLEVARRIAFHLTQAEQEAAEVIELTEENDNEHDISS